MKRAILAVLVVLVAASLYAAPEDFWKIVDFSISTPDLVEIVRSERFELLEPGKYNLLTGSVASTLVIDPNPETFQALVELVTGEWIGLESIEVYRIYVLLEGPDFSNRVLDRLPRDPGPEVILTNSELLVVAEFIGVADGEDGLPIPVVSAIAVR